MDRGSCLPSDCSEGCAFGCDYETTREKVSLPASRTWLLACTHRLLCRGSRGPRRPSLAQMLVNPSSSKSSAPSRTGPPTTAISTSMCLKLRSSDYETTNYNRIRTLESAAKHNKPKRADSAQILQETYEGNGTTPRAFCTYLQTKGGAGMEEVMIASNSFP
jgi:hypothetical protein